MEPNSGSSWGTFLLPAQLGRKPHTLRPVPFCSEVQICLSMCIEAGPAPNPTCALGEKIFLKSTLSEEHYLVQQRGILTLSDARDG